MKVNQCIHSCCAIMKSSMAIILLVLFNSAIIPNASAQNENWSDAAEKDFIKTSVKKLLPVKYRTVRLDEKAMRQFLLQAPAENSVPVKSSPFIIELPMPDGGFAKFRAVEYDIFEKPGLYPDIKTYLGQGIDDPYATVRFDMTVNGFHAQVLSATKGTVYIDPYSHGNTRDYISFYKKDLPVNPEPKQCMPDAGNNNFIKSIDKKKLQRERHLNKIDNDNNAERTSGTHLRTYRLALAGDSTYVQYWVTPAAALAAMATTMSRVNGIYENEVDLRMILIANNSDIVFATDDVGYKNVSGAGPTWAHNQHVIDSIIGNANYDIGHLFKAVGGITSFGNIGSVCRPAVKANGFTSIGAPTGDAFDVDFVAHEIGHQFGANHTFNDNSFSPCSGGAYTAGHGYEPGTGSTIMGYAGGCGASSLQSNSDPYFHVHSIDQILTYSQVDSGSTCPVSIATLNSLPTINVGLDYSIPMMTPFKLSGTITDADADPITYCWEEFDLGPPGLVNFPTGNAAIFRSFSPTTDSTRTFPQMSDLVRNIISKGEILPAYSRVLNFELTARDNRALGGGINYNDSPKLVSVVGTGPFQVTSPNTSMFWEANGIETVTWSLGGSDVPPISCTLVDILLSVDSGYTYPYLLKSHVPNDGTEDVVVPDVLSTIARVMVRSVGNIFFDISNVNFEIHSNPITITEVIAQVSCNGSSDGSIDITVTGDPPFTHHWNTGAVTEDLAGLAPGVYTDTVSDAFGETCVKSFIITEPPVLTASCSSISTSCAFTTDGYCTVVTSGGTAPYTFLWSNGAIGAVNAAIGAGSYSVVVTDNNGCTATCSASVSAPPAITASVTVLSPISCHGSPSGCIFVSASGGIPPYTPIGSMCSLYAGTHTIVVTDAAGCASAPVSVTLTEPSTLNLTVTLLSPILCHGGTTCVSVTPSGGTPPYVPYPFTTTICGITAGYHPFNIVDDNFCIGIGSIFIPEPPALITSCGGSDIVCRGDGNGVSFVLPSGGTPPYTYLWNNGGITPYIDNLNSGTYSVDVYDANGCYNSCSHQVTEPDSLIVLTTASALSCHGDSTGIATATVTGGVPPYDYLWTTSETTPSIGNLTAGDYQVLVTDVGGCIDSTTATITEPDTLVATCTVISDETCPGDANGMITVDATGGTPPYGGLASYPGLSPGTYTYTVTDANGCSATCTSAIITINTESTAPTGISTGTPFNSICLGSSVTLSVDGGSLGSGAGWQWYQGGCGAFSPIGSANTVTFTPASTGTYHYYVRAEGICNTTSCASITIYVMSAPPAGGISITGAPSDGCVGGTSTLTTNVVTGASFYRWSGPGGILFNGHPSPYDTIANSVTISYTSLPLSGSSGWSVCVFAGNSCGSTGTVCTWIRAKVSKPGSIAGSAIGCPGGSGTYSVPIVAGAASYQWSATGGMIISGNGSPSISISFPAGFVSGTLCCHAQTACGYNSTDVCMNISRATALPGIISGTSYVCPGLSATYSIASVSGAASYNWTCSVPGSVVSPGGATCSILFPSTIPPGSVVCVSAVSSCGYASTVRCKGIASGMPNIPGNITGLSFGQCGATGVSYSVSPVTNALGYFWTATGGATINGPNTLSAATIDFPASFTNCVVSVSSTNTCGMSAARTLTVNGKPSTPPVILGNNSVCNGSVESYSTAGSGGASSYIWTVPSGAVIIGPTDGLSISVMWGVAGGNITCKASNDCGISGTRTLAVSVTCRTSQLQNTIDQITEVFPNPTDGKITVKIISTNAEKIQFKVTDVVGKLLSMESISIDEGQNLHTLDLTGFSKGIYFIQLNGKRMNRVVKITVE